MEKQFCKQNSRIRMPKARAKVKVKGLFNLCTVLQVSPEAPDAVLAGQVLHQARTRGVPNPRFQPTIVAASTLSGLTEVGGTVPENNEDLIITGE